MAGDKDEFALGGAGDGPFEEVGGFCRDAILIDAEKADIETVARELEVVGISAEEGDLLLGGENEANVGVAAVAVEVILAALVERDDPALEPGRGPGFGFDFGADFPAGERGFVAGGVGGDGGDDSVGDVFGGLKNLEFDILAPELLGRRPGQEAVAGVIVFVGTQFWRASAPTCWLVMTRPSPLTKEAEAPSKRTEERIRWVSQASVGSKS